MFFLAKLLLSLQLWVFINCHSFQISLHNSVLKYLFALWPHIDIIQLDRFVMSFLLLLTILMSSPIPWNDFTAVGFYQL